MFGRTFRQTLILGIICLVFALPFLFFYTLPYLPQSILAPFFSSRPFLLADEILFSTEYAIRDKIVRSGRLSVPDSNLVYLAIDNSSLKLDHLSPEEIASSEGLSLMASQWPWKRSVYELILNRLFESGAKLVAIDLLFLSPSSEDPSLAMALEKYKDKVIIGANIVPQPTGEVIDIPSDSIVPQKIPFDDRVAFVNFFPDGDGTIRRTLFRKILGKSPASLKGPNDVELISLTTRVLEKAHLEDRIPQQFSYPMIRFAGPPGTFKPIPICQLFDPTLWPHPNHLDHGKFFKDKIVLIGPHGNWSQDEHATTMGMMPGPEIHLNSINAALHDDFINEAPTGANLLIILAAAGMAWAISLAIRHPLTQSIVVVLFSLFFLGLNYFLYNYGNVFILTFTPLFVFDAGAITCLVYEFLLERLEKSRVRSTLEKYVSRNVVAEMLDNQKDYETALGGARKNVTILFSDIRGFTTMTEKADSQNLVKQLNEYLTEMVECVFAHHGTLDKFIGDAVMAVWGNTLKQSSETSAVNAVKSALAMRKSLNMLNSKWQAEGRETFQIGIGLNRGEVIVGNMGSPKRMEFTVIGDPVNLASRIEGLTKMFHQDILIGENVAFFVREQFLLRPVALVQVKGKTHPVEIFSVIGELGVDEIPEPLQKSVHLFEKGILDYRNRKFKEAIEFFKQCQTIDPEDALTEIYLKESLCFLENPPSEDWKGVNVMHEK